MKITWHKVEGKSFTTNVESDGLYAFAVIEHRHKSQFALFIYGLLGNHIHIKIFRTLREAKLRAEAILSAIQGE